MNRSISSSVNGVRFTRIVDTDVPPQRGRRGGDDDVTARVVHPELAQRLARGRDVAGGAVRLVVEVVLAELRGDDPIRGEMLQALLDRVARVEVALRQHERARVRGVGRRVAVGRGIPHEVVVVVAAGQVGAPVAVHVVHLGVLGDVAGVVGEVVGDEVVGDRVQLDGVDVTGVVVERGQHLVPTGGADDHLPLRRCAERRERQRPDVGVEAEVAEGCVARRPSGRSRSRSGRRGRGPGHRATPGRRRRGRWGSTSSRWCARGSRGACCRRGGCREAREGTTTTIASTAVRMPAYGTTRERLRIASRSPQPARSSAARKIVETGPICPRSSTTIAQARPAPIRSAKYRRPMRSGWRPNSVEMITPIAT